MDTYFVYYHDDYYDSEVRLREFLYLDEATKFIEERLKITEPNLANYTLIYGHKLTIKEKTVITKITTE
jgi:hypothetical protein